MNAEGPSEGQRDLQSRCGLLSSRHDAPFCWLNRSGYPTNRRENERGEEIRISSTT